jgi:dCMP deaminase
MATTQETDEMYMGIAILHSRLSKAKRAQVGACLVTDHGTILGGVNGTPRGMDNTCETVIKTSVPEHLSDILVTKPEVIHAELQTILKAAREGVSCIGATMYVTLSPCIQCAAMMLQAGVKRVVYLQQYRDNSGVKLLQESNVVIQSYDQL